jgi:hypothetical protein
MYHETAPRWSSVKLRSQYFHYFKSIIFFTAENSPAWIL